MSGESFCVGDAGTGGALISKGKEPDSRWKSRAYFLRHASNKAQRMKKTKRSFETATLPRLLLTETPLIERGAILP